MDSLKIIQTNIQSLRRNREELNHILHEEKFHVACLQENWLKRDKKNYHNRIQHNTIRQG